MLTRTVLCLAMLTIPALTVRANAATPAYLQGTPLGTQVSAAVRDCRAGDQWNVPLITWGADEVTVAANGNNLRTVAGSAFAKRGLNIVLKREDKFAEQVKAYLNCDSPFLRATLGMAVQAADLTEADPRTRMVAIYQHSWSAGGDAMVARADIRQPKDLKGRTVVVQRNGPHLDYLLKILADAGLSASDVTIRYTAELTGKGLPTPAEAMRSDGSVGAVMVISTDAATLTSDNTVGTGAEGSVKGAHTLLSTKSANRIITDLYLVRRDFYDANRDKLSAFTSVLLETEGNVRAMARTDGSDWNALMKASARILLDDEGAVADAKGLWGDAETTGRQGNAQFFADFNYPRSFNNVSTETQALLRNAGNISGSYRLSAADWDWQKLTGVADVSVAAAPRFNPDEASRAVGRIREQAGLSNDTLFTFEINFKPNQRGFSAATYSGDFDRVVQLVSTYSGAVLTIEGHADPLGYLQQRRNMERDPKGVDTVLLNRMVQSGRNLSIQRAQEVRQAIIEQARAKGVSLDPTQFVTAGLGYDSPATGICGDRPCEPKNEREWLSNMRVQFRIVNIEAEANAFVPVH